VVPLCSAFLCSGFAHYASFRGKKKKAYTFSLMWVPSIPMHFLDLWCLCVLPFFAMDLPIRLVSKTNKRTKTSSLHLFTNVGPFNTFALP